MTKYTKNYKQKTINKKKIHLFFCIIALGSLFVFLDISSLSFFKKQDSQTQNIINYDPPTDEEKKTGDEIKAQITKDVDQKPAEDNSNSPAPINKSDSVSVVISDANQYGDSVEVRAFIPNYLKSGVCTFTFTLDSLIVIKESPANPDATATICSNITISRSEFSQPGNWQLKVNFTNEDVDSTSDSQGVIIT